MTRQGWPNVRRRRAPGQPKLGDPHHHLCAMGMRVLGWAQHTGCYCRPWRSMHFMHGDSCTLFRRCGANAQAPTARAVTHACMRHI